MNVAELYFSLYGDDFDPAAITLRLGIRPTSSYRKGDETAYNKSIKFSCWCISTGKNSDNHPDFYEMSKFLVDILDDKVDQILELKEQHNLKISLQAAITYDQNIGKPIIGFDADVIAFLSKLGASIDVDIY